MTRNAFSFITMLCLSLVALDARVAAKESWISVRSENFTLVGNASEGEIREVAARLEQYRSVLARLLPGSETSLTLPTTVIVFKNDEAFKPFRPIYQGKPTNVAGYFQPGRDVNYIAISAERKGENSYGTIFHELVHLFIENRLHGLPLCFSEGLADYYSTLKISDDGKKILIGKENVQHVRRLLSEKELLPLRTLLAADYESPYYNESDHRSVFYAQSWALVHYLLHKDVGNNLDLFSGFLNRLAEGATLEEALQHAFQTDVGEIEKGLKAYVRQSPYPANQMVFGQRLEFEKKMQSARITDALAQAYLGDLLLHIHRSDEAENYLQKALTLDAKLAMAQASLGMLRLKQQRVGEAIQILKRAADADPQNYLAQYYYAYALSREGMGDEGTVWGYEQQTAAAMRAALRRTRELSPRFIEGYRLHAFLNLALNEQLDEAEALLKRALELSPGRQDMLLVLAQVHLRQSKFQETRQALQPILLRAADMKLREQAQALLEDLNYAEKLAARPERQARANEEGATAAAQPARPDASEQAHSAKPRLAKRFKGERVRGLLAGIECMDAGVVLFVKVGDRVLRLHGEQLRSIFFVTYVAGLDRTVTCGMRQREISVVLTYRPANNPQAKFDGEAVAIEFVPEEIDIEP
jgi:tetratricopeptide (TPR) repeat protein